MQTHNFFFENTVDNANQALKKGELVFLRIVSEI